jgi:hypothetical protein
MTMPVPAPGTDAATLGRQFELCHGVFVQNTEGITAEDSLVSPPAGGNCINWVGGHIVASRNSVLALLGAERVGSPDQWDRYARGTEPITSPSDGVPWEEIRAAFETSQERFREALSRATPDDLAAPLPEDANPFGVESVGQMLAAFAFHEAYHVGQLGVLRRVAGREPAIR